MYNILVPILHCNIKAVEFVIALCCHISLLLHQHFRSNLVAITTGQEEWGLLWIHKSQVMHVRRGMGGTYLIRPFSSYISIYVGGCVMILALGIL